MLLHFLRKSRADRVIQKRAKEDCVVVGVSAGAVVLGSSIQIVECGFGDKEDNDFRTEC